MQSSIHVKVATFKKNTSRHAVHHMDSKSRNRLSAKFDSGSLQEANQFHIEKNGMCKLLGTIQVIQKILHCEQMLTMC